MPNAPLRHCTYPGCAKLVTKGRCSSHQYKRKRTKRPTTTSQGYGAGWRRIRDQYLSRHPMCEIRIKCRGDKATAVDHIVPKARGGTDDESNLQSACHRCHSAKTARNDVERRGGRFHGVKR